MPIADRIAALNLQQVGRCGEKFEKAKEQSLGEVEKPSATRPAPATRRSERPQATLASSSTTQSPLLPLRSSQNTQTLKDKPPSLPPRQPSNSMPALQSPPTPAPKGTQHVMVGFSGPLIFSGVAKQPGGAVLNTEVEKASLTPSLQSRHGPPQNVQRPPLLTARSMPAAVLSTVKPPVPARPSMPLVPPMPPLPASRSRKSALDFGFNNKPPVPSVPPQIISQTIDDNAVSSIRNTFRPYLNLATKPTLSQQTNPAIPLYSLRPNTSRQDCLLCRDFSGPDTHAARFPRQNVTSLPTQAQDLTNPFTNLTDQARAIFIWLHHNIDYNTEAFFNHNVKPSTPASTLNTGLAVCEGYAGLFANLAMHAGLDCVVIGGHGKGFGHVSLQPGQAPPEFKSNHAWNALRIEDVDGGWKLIDSCWGAGHINNERQWVTALHVEHFTMSNAEFGLKHFPSDIGQWFSLPPNAGGPPRPPSWVEYIASTTGMHQVDVMKGNQAEENGFGGRECFMPWQGNVDFAEATVRGPTLRFAISKICPHWDNIWLYGRGKTQRPFMLYYGKGQNTKYLPFRMTDDAAVWCVDVDIADARRRCNVGEDIWCVAVQDFDGRDASGLHADEVVRMMGRKSFSFQGVAKWTIGNV